MAGIQTNEKEIPGAGRDTMWSRMRLSVGRFLRGESGVKDKVRGWKKPEGELGWG